MKTSLKLVAILFVTLLISCGSNEEKKVKTQTNKKKNVTEKVNKVPASKRVDLTSKGVGPITSITLETDINQKMADKGKDIYSKMCLACHKLDKKFIGPAPIGIMERRTPEWIMNMILVPEKMVKEDALAKDLLMEFNGAPMANQNLTEEDARAVLEYFRTLK
ncbi:c-type cytochrome [Polaribacter uvawellassae]|uniref:c-type cytochrome n=1 Tax=Polaribacter uvawellassae TaxID=3133495 RepID=UPI00321921B2